MTELDARLEEAGVRGDSTSAGTTGTGVMPPIPTPRHPRKPTSPRPQTPEALLAAVREAYGLLPNTPLSAEGTLAADVSVAQALWDHLEDPSLPRPHLPGDPPLRPADPALKTAAARRTAISLGRQLHALRTARGLTQQQAGALIGWDQPQWARLEAGRVYPTLATLDLLASRLGVRMILSPDPGGLVITLEPVAADA